MQNPTENPEPTPLPNPEVLPKLVELLQKEVDRVEEGLTLQARIIGRKLEFTLNDGIDARGATYDLIHTLPEQDIPRFVGQVSMLVCQLAWAFRRAREREEAQLWLEEHGCQGNGEHDWRRGFYTSTCRRCSLTVRNGQLGGHPTDPGAAP